MVLNYSINMCVYFVNYLCLVLMLTLVTRVPMGVESYQTFKFEDFCGFSASRYESVGILQFNISTFVSRHSYKEKCTLTLTPKPLTGSGGAGRILFYFSRFRFAGDCANMNLTLAEENGAPIKGAPGPLCGNNASLSTPGLVFNTSGTSLEIQLHWDQYRTREHPELTTDVWQYGGFDLKYAAYYEGSCDDETTKCQNGRCSDKTEHCNGNIDTCGGGEESACAKSDKEKGFWETFKDNLVENAETLAIVIGVIVVLYYGFKMLQRMRTRHGSLRNYVTSLCGGNSRPAAYYHRDSISLNERSDESVPLENRESRRSSTCDSLNSDRRDKTGLAAPPPSYDTLGARGADTEPLDDAHVQTNSSPYMRDDTASLSSNTTTSIQGRLTRNESHNSSSTINLDTTGAPPSNNDAQTDRRSYHYAPPPLDAQAPPPSYPDAPLPHYAPLPPAPLAPPPSYDEFIANENKY